MGFRLAIAHPERLEALVVQNAVAHEDGLGPLWKTRREFWADRETHEAALRENFFSFAATQQRHMGDQPEPCGVRAYRSSQLCPPRPDHPVADLFQERIKRRLVLGGLLSEYERAA